MQLTLLYKQWIDGYLYVRGVACSERTNQLISAVPLSSMNESFTVFSLFQAVAALYTCSASRSTEFGKLLNKTVCLQLYLWDIYHVVVFCPLLAKKTKECCFKQTQSCTFLKNVLGAFFSSFTSKTNCRCLFCLQPVWSSVCLCLLLCWTLVQQCIYSAVTLMSTCNFNWRWQNWWPTLQKVTQPLLETRMWNKTFVQCRMALIFHKHFIACYFTVWTLQATAAEQWSESSAFNRLTFHWDDGRHCVLYVKCCAQVSLCCNFVLLAFLKGLCPFAFCAHWWTKTHVITSVRNCLSRSVYVHWLIVTSSKASTPCVK